MSELAKFRQRLTELNLHWAGVAVLAVLNLYLLVQLGFLWQAAQGSSAEALATQRQALGAAVKASKPLAGLDVKLKTANDDADDFYAERLPVGYSGIATELGAVLKKHNIRLSRIQYSQVPVADLASSANGGQLTEVRMDAALAGDYRGLVESVNGLERDKLFFLIDGMTLTGQDSGKVNLRMKMTTYIRGRSSDEEAARASTPDNSKVDAKAGGAR